jgi:hypothetical protein
VLALLNEIGKMQAVVRLNTIDKQNYLQDLLLSVPSEIKLAARRVEGQPEEAEPLLL